ncbi:MAG: ASKHA domain-containing protein [Actinomycetota bacterium]|nr:ASKHA domain-containing protein [Actinomycetota bacterium]
MEIEKRESLIVFTPSGHRDYFENGLTLLEAARKLGVDIDSVCGGRGICGRCQIEPTFGDFAKHNITSSENNISAQGDAETKYKGRKKLEKNRRLSCSAKILGDLVVDVPPDSQIHKQVVRKTVDLTDLQIDPVISLHFIEIENQNNKPSSDQLITHLKEQWELEDLKNEIVGIPAPSSDGTFTAIVRDKKSVISVWPGFRDQIFGIAIDVGSTTIAGHLCDLLSGEVLSSAGIMNPQIRFGEDLMSRVSYVMMNENGKEELTEAVQGAIDDLVGELCENSNTKREDVFEITLVGNPIMHHLFLGYDPTTLGVAPFTLIEDKAIDIPASNLFINANEATRVHVLPCIAGHVGADTAGVLLATKPQLNDGINLVVDVGTNAEIILSGKGRILAASSPTGPAFEGAQISSGQRATPGAIERVRINPENGEARFKVIGVDAWSDEEGFSDEIIKTGVTGICGSGIIEVVAELLLARLMTIDGVIGGDGTNPSEYVESDGRTFSYVLYESSEIGKRILITQNDVRAVQLAKAALYAGIRLLMDYLETDQIDSIQLAGAFGSHIDTMRATVLGLIPDCEKEKVSSIGNAAGSGALMALLSNESRNEIQKTINNIEKIEIATEAAFQEHFVEAMAIPHKTAEYQFLGSYVDLPPKNETTSLKRNRRTKRKKTDD